ncbi:MAG: hypothetical protein FJ358_07825 [Thaumarchaeota archaeon]|nr:hypothetical protein [Nitrososphaerota archaeon]
MVAYLDETFRDHIGDALEKFERAGGGIQAIIGVDSRGTSKTALEWMLNLLGSNRLHIYHNPADATFHPKVFTIKETSKAYVFMGSSNLTGGGLSRNFEMNVEMELDLQDQKDRACLSTIEEIFKKTVNSPSCLKLDTNTLEKIDNAGALKKRSSRKGETAITKKAGKTLSALFGSTKHVYPKKSTKAALQVKQKFIMSLVNNDVSGKRWDPYFLIPIGARNKNPLFWGWPAEFHRTGAHRRPERLFIAGIKVGRRRVTEQSRLRYYSGVDEFRFKSKSIYGLGTGYSGSFLVISWSTGKTGQGTANIDLVRKGTKKHTKLGTLPFHKVGSLQKKYTYV